MNKWNNLFSQDIVIPENVKTQVDSAFSIIQMEGNMDIQINQTKKREIKEEREKKQNKSQHKTLRNWIRVAAIIGITILLGAGSVYASTHTRFHLADFIINIPKDARKYINTTVTSKSPQDNLTNMDSKYIVDQNELDSLQNQVFFTVRESITDSTSFHILIEAELTDPSHYLLIPHDIYNEMLDNESCSYRYTDAKEDETIEEYAARTKRQILIVSSLLQDDACNYLSSTGEKILDETHVTFYISGSLFSGTISEGTEIHVNNTVRTLTEKGYKSCHDETIPIVLEMIAQTEESTYFSFANEKEMRIENSPIIIQEIMVTNTALETKVTFTIINEDPTWGNWMDIQLIDDNKTPYPFGPSGGYASLPNEDGEFISYVSYEKMELPDHVNIQIRNLYTDEEYQLPNIPISEAR